MNETASNSPDDINELAGEIFDFILHRGNATRDEIRAHCKELGHGTDVYRKALDKLTRNANVITEATNDEGRKVLSVKESVRSAGVSWQQLLIATELSKPETKEREKFDNWYRISGIFTLRTPCLAPQPDPRDPSSRIFVRNGENLVLLSGYFAAMLKTTARTGVAPEIGNAVYRILWDAVELPESLIVRTLRPVPPSRPGASGQGVTSCESLLPGVEIPFCAFVPGNKVDPGTFELMLEVAGRLVGFSPAASHKGWGRFTVDVDSGKEAIAAE